MDNPTAEQIPSNLSPPDQKLHAAPGHSIRNALCLGIVGAIAAAISSGAIRQTGEVFQLPEEIQRLTAGTIPGLEDRAKIGKAIVELNYKHAALWIGMAGAIGGVLFGLTLGILRGSRKSLVVGTVGGLVVGAVFSAIGGLAGTWLAEGVISEVKLAKMHVPEQYSMLLHGTTWLCVGLGIGLGTGLGTTKNRIGSVMGSMLMGGIGAAVGGALYPIVASVAMPFVDPSMAIPKDELNRFVWIALPYVMTGLVLGRKG
jgi:hypothetical protein